MISILNRPHPNLNRSTGVGDQLMVASMSRSHCEFVPAPRRKLPLPWDP